MVDRLKLHEKPRIRCRHSGGALEPESRCFAGLHRNQSTGPRLKTCRGDVIRPPIRVENMKRANAPAALSGPRFSRPPALPEGYDFANPSMDGVRLMRSWVQAGCSWHEIFRDWDWGKRKRAFFRKVGFSQTVRPSGLRFWSLWRRHRIRLALPDEND